LLVKIVKSGDKTRPGVVGDKVADCLTPADAAQIPGAIEWMEAGVSQFRGISNIVEPGCGDEQRCIFLGNSLGEELGASCDAFAVRESVGNNAEDVSGLVGCGGDYLRSLTPLSSLAPLDSLQVVRHGLLAVRERPEGSSASATSGRFSSSPSYARPTPRLH
jgi:hypothetical protein